MTWLPSDYAEARERFVNAARARRWTHHALPVAGATASGLGLTIDVAIREPLTERAERCLVVSSALHGVEGFLGSAVQLALLERDPWPPDLRVVLVHAPIDSGPAQPGRGHFAAAGWP